MLKWSRGTFAAVMAMMIVLIAPSADAQLPPPGKDSFTLSLSRSANQDLVLTWQISNGTYLYRDKIAVTGPAGKAIAIETSPGEAKDDPTFGPVEIYRREASASIEAGTLPDSGHIAVTYQGCSDSGICFPPVTRNFDLITLAAVADAPSQMPAVSSSMDSTALPSATDDSSASPQFLDGPIAVVLAAFLGFGLLLALTPCMFPMIPILSGLLTANGSHMTATRGLLISGTYVVAMASAYALIGMGAAWSGQNLQMALQTPLVLGLMSAVFVVLALSMFGFFELRLPSAWVNFIARRTATAGGSAASAGVLGFGSALIVGPCVTPPLSAALLYAGQTGDAVKSGAALFALGLGMGAPLLAFGIFGPRVLPRSGPWLAAVNTVFGGIFLGLAIVMLSRVLPPPAALAAWGVFAIGVGVFLGAFDRDGTEPSTGRRFERTLGIAAVVYGVTLLIGFASGASDPLRPLSEIAGRSIVPESAKYIVASAAELEQVIAEAKSQQKPFLVGFSAEWCSECKTIERTVLTDPRVQASLQDVTSIRIDVTRADSASFDLMRRFGVAGPPTYFVLDANATREVPGARRIGGMTADDLIQMIALAERV